MKILAILSSFLNLAGTIMLVFGLTIKEDKDYQCILITHRTKMTICGIIVLVLAFGLQVFSIVRS